LSEVALTITRFGKLTLINPVNERSQWTRNDHIERMLFAGTQSLPITLGTDPRRG
jgi:hypothetical protein